ncbi:hypothetical protein ACIPF8_19610 [Collimonas sp. NPDC087041]|uniref:Uncharacterized protein n=2 Tax=Collimonas arenae TaxID=279058 RepID=A0A127QLA0_9BURK|nr:hypothetical protein [Collimonas arenae]AMP00886.1 hypothetical protein CAter10_3369 [Collimonas arenae]AMP10776.1 hypothetical protein CAter282_3065 [Collimonas arenae]
MKASKIIEMWGRASCQVPLTSDDEIVQMFANEIAKLSYKLTEEELYRLIAVGALVYQRGFREFDSNSMADLLIRTLREGGRA